MKKLIALPLRRPLKLSAGRASALPQGVVVINGVLFIDGQPLAIDDLVLRVG